MGFKTTNRQVVEEVEYGMFVWVLPDGEWLGDGEGNVMNVFCMERKDRPRAARAIIEAAKAYGYPEGKLKWLSGRRPIDDEELERQIGRAINGQTPDPFDIPSIMAEARELKLDGR